MSALAPIATAKADSHKRSCLLYPQKQTCAARQRMSAMGQADITGLSLLKVNGLVTASRVELCTPHLVHALMLRSAESHGRAEPNVEVTEILESSYQPFGVKLTAILFQRGNQHVGRHVTFEGHIVRLLPREVFGERRFVIHDQRRVAINCRHDLRDDDPSCILFAEKH